jgi:hypothetical protein
MRILSQFIYEASLGKKVLHSTATAHFYTRNGIGRIAQKETRENSILFNFRSLELQLGEMFFWLDFANPQLMRRK